MLPWSKEKYPSVSVGTVTASLFCGGVMSKLYELTRDAEKKNDFDPNFKGLSAGFFFCIFLKFGSLHLAEMFYLSFHFVDIYFSGKRQILVFQNVSLVLPEDLSIGLCYPEVTLGRMAEQNRVLHGYIDPRRLALVFRP